MRGLSRIIVAVLSGTWCVSIPAHHSFAMFDRERILTLTGVVKEFQWTNPHVFIELDVPGPDGDAHWSLEGGSTNMLKRAGWKSTTLKPGDRVTVKINPLRSGANGGAFNEVMLNGQVLKLHAGPPSN